MKQFMEHTNGRTYKKLKGKQRRDLNGDSLQTSSIINHLKIIQASQILLTKEEILKIKVSDLTKRYIGLSSVYKSCWLSEN